VFFVLGCALLRLNSPLTYRLWLKSFDPEWARLSRPLLWWLLKFDIYSDDGGVLVEPSLVYC